MLGMMSDTYRWARRAMATAYDRQKDADFHAWREAIQDHCGHMRLLADVCPEEMRGRLEVLEQLRSLLGEDQDLSVLAETLACDDRVGEREQPVVLGRIGQRQYALRAMARPLGRRLFARATGGVQAPAAVVLEGLARSVGRWPGASSGSVGGSRRNRTGSPGVTSSRTRTSRRAMSQTIDLTALKARFRGQLLTAADGDRYQRAKALFNGMFDAAGRR